MKIAILSGKGGTGKTFFATNLAYISAPSQYVDLDVEAPNGHLFFKPDIHQRKTIYTKVPKVDANLCDGCRACVDFCRFNALAYINQKVQVFESMCHHCGGCALVCPQKAIKEVNHRIGELKIGTYENIRVLSGYLDANEVSGIPIIHALKSLAEDEPGDCFYDCPPGVACATIESIKDADACLLIVEDSLFGFDNFVMAYELTKVLHKKTFVVLNKIEDKQSACETYCQKEGLLMLERFSFDQVVAKVSARGDMVAKTMPAYAERFKHIYQQIREELL